MAFSDQGGEEQLFEVIVGIRGGSGLRNRSQAAMEAGVGAGVVGLEDGLAVAVPTASKVAAVGKAVKALGRTGAPVTRVGVAQLAGVSRSFTYENDAVNSIIAEAQTRTQARAEGRIEKRTVQEEAS